MSANIIELSDLTKTYDGKRAVDVISTQAGAGEVIGLVGRNGSGKSTLLEMLIGLVRPDSGTGRLLGCDIRSIDDEVRQQTGFVFQEDELFGWMRVSQHLDLVSRHYAAWDADRVQSLMREWNLPMHKKVETLSRGQRQMFGIVLAIGHNPRVLLLDEPASALDPVARRRFLSELVEMAGDERRTMIFSSHLLSDLERVASRIWLLRDGKLMVDEPLDILKDQLVRIEISGRDAGEQIELPDTIRKRHDEFGTSIVAHRPPDKILAQLRGQFGSSCNIRHLNLEQIAEEFLQ